MEIWLHGGPLDGKWVEVPDDATSLMVPVPIAEGADFGAGNWTKEGPKDDRERVEYLIERNEHFKGFGCGYCTSGDEWN